MSIKSGIVLTLTLVIVTFSGALDAQHRKPTVEIELRVLHREPPATLAEMLNRVDLAAYVNVLSSQPRARQIPGGSEHHTFFVAEIAETGRTNRSVRSKEKIRIVQRGGVFQEADRILSVAERGNPPLVAGRSYLLMLVWNETEQIYQLAYGANSVFEIQTGKVFPRGKSAAARELTGKNLKEAISRIR